MNIQDLNVSSMDFEPNAPLAERFSAEGGNQAPRIRVSGVPAEAVELALICHDPDAPMPRGFAHWVVYGIPTDTETVTGEPGPYRFGPNATGTREYFGPRPPEGHGLHRYYFWVYALSEPVDGEPTREEFLERHAQSIIEQNRIVGTFQR